MATESGTDAGQSAREGAYRAGGGTQRLADVGKAEAKAVWDDTKASVRSALSEKQSSTAGDLGQFAGALRNASRDIDQNSTVARFAMHAADNLDQLSGTLRNKDFDGLLRDVQAFARSQPALFVGMAVAAGFLATRFLKSGPPESDAGGRTEARSVRASPAYAEAGLPEPASYPETESTFPQDPRRT